MLSTQRAAILREELYPLDMKSIGEIGYSLTTAGVYYLAYEADIVTR